MNCEVKKLFSPSKVLFLGLLTTILLGATLLSFPISSRSGTWTPFINSMFTATSATCVTGLIVYDTYNYWSGFGQAVILSLIQIGGLGFMTFFSLVSIILKKRILLYERILIKEAAGSIGLGGVVKLVKRIAIGSFAFEAAGAIALSIRFIPQMGIKNGIWNAVFHSVSAFCNAGFDITGRFGAFSSLTTYANDPLVVITIMLLIIIGGIGFIVWNDLYTNKLSFKKYQLHTKIVLLITSVLIFGGALLMFVFERNNTFSNMSIGESVLNSFFGVVTPRTAGFNTVPMTELSNGGYLLTVILMFIGGSPGSTAGGIKTTTFAVLMISTFIYLKHNNGVVVFKRRISSELIKRASAIATIYFVGVMVATVIISTIDPVSIRNTVFEVVSAVATVGLSTGITSTLSALSKILLIILMFVGRIGGITLLLAFARNGEPAPVNRPTEQIVIG